MGKKRPKLGSGDWHIVIDREAAKCANFTGIVRVNVSGGDGSAVAWKRCLEWYGKDRVVPVFADTKSEHDDLYRFVEDCEREFCQKVNRLVDGRNIWDVFVETGMARMAQNGGACKASVELKQKLLDAHLLETGITTIATGLEFMEPERMEKLIARMAPVNVLFPLSVAPLLNSCAIHDEVRSFGIKPCAVYDDGHPHNNCRKYGCVLQGLSQWAFDAVNNPDGFDYAATREQEFIEKTGFSICRDRTGGETTNYPLVQLGIDARAGKTFPFDFRSQCSCMMPAMFTDDQLF